MSTGTLEALTAALTANTAAIEAQTTFLKSLGGKTSTSAGTATTAAPPKTTTTKKSTGPKVPSADDMKAAFGAWLGKKDGKRSERVAQLARLTKFLDVEAVSAIEEGRRLEVMGYLDILNNGEEPDYGDGDGDGEDEDDAAAMV